MKLFTLIFLLVVLVAVNRTGAVFNGEEEKPGLHEEVVIKQETQIVQGAVERVKQQAARAVAQRSSPVPSQATAPSPVASVSPSSPWVSWVQNVLLLAAAVAVFYRMNKLA